MKTIKILSVMLICCTTIMSGEKFPLISFYTPSHKVLYTDYFIKSFNEFDLADNFNLIVEQFKQESSSASYMSDGWNTTMMRKVELILSTIEKNPEKIFIYADIDIQFFNSFNPEEFLGKNDIVIQQNRIDQRYACAGFFIARANSKTKNLWQQVLNRMLSNPNLDDQVPLNLILNENKNNIIWDLLPIEFFNPALTNGPQVWIPTQQLILPKAIILHHANWTIGLNNKIKQLNLVREWYVSHKQP